MEFFVEAVKFIFYAGLIVLISKYILVRTLRNLAKSLNLQAKVVGNIAGYATSVPELLTIGASSFKGLLGASMYNVVSSNVINLIQYIFSILLNKNGKALKNKAIIMNLTLSILTIIIPILLIAFNINLGLEIVPAFIIMYAFFVFINTTVHNKYLKIEEPQIEKVKEEAKGKKTANIIKYSIYLLATGLLLFIVGNQLGNTLERLCSLFNVPEMIIGILLGFITSIPELITFFEAQKHHKKMENEMLGVVEATNNLLISNILNLFVIQSVGIIIFVLMA